MKRISLLKILTCLLVVYPCIVQGSGNFFEQEDFSGSVLCDLPLRSENPLYRCSPEMRRQSNVDILMLDDVSFADDVSSEESFSGSSTDSFSLGESDGSDGEDYENQPPLKDLTFAKQEHYRESAIDVFVKVQDLLKREQKLNPVMYLNLCVAYAVLDDYRKADEMLVTAKRMLLAEDNGQQQFEKLRSLVTECIRKDQQDGYVSRQTAAYVVSSFYVF